MKKNSYQKKSYPKKSQQDYQQEIKQYMDSATNKIDAYIRNEKDIYELLNFMAQFHTYSFRNQALIQDQFSGASAVGSFKAFSDAGFKINKGEKAMKVFVPVNVTTFIDSKGVSKRLSEATKEEKQLIQSKKIETTQKRHYKLGNVFDVSQTNAGVDDLPKIFPNRPYNFSFEGNETHFLKALKEVSESRGVPVSESFDIGVAKGQYTYTAFSDSRIIELNPRFDVLNQSATLIHEMGHASLHHHKDGLTKAEREFQAELVSHVVSKHFGLDTEEKSIPYVATWSKNGQDIENKRQLLKDVQETSSLLIKEIHEKYKEPVIDKDIKQANKNVKQDPSKNEKFKASDIEKEKKPSLSVTKEEIAEAKKVSIVDVSNAYGYQLTKHSTNEYRLADNHSVAVFLKTNSFSDFDAFSPIKGGDSIAFVQQVIGVTDFKEAVKLLNNDSFERVVIQDKKHEKYVYDKSKESPTFHRATNYLVNERGVNPKLVEKLHSAGYIREDVRGNVLFCWYDQNKIVGCTEQGTVKNNNYKRGSWKAIQENSPSSTHGFNVKFGQPEHLKFFEASIDALSYATLYPEKMSNTWLISMEGLNENKMLDYVKRSYDMTGSVPKSISVGVDNDAEGVNFFKGLSLIKRELLTNEIPQKPVGKEALDKWDWNDQNRFFRHEGAEVEMMSKVANDYGY